MRISRKKSSCPGLLLQPGDEENKAIGWRSAGLAVPIDLIA